MDAQLICTFVCLFVFLHRFSQDVAQITRTNKSLQENSCSILLFSVHLFFWAMYVCFVCVCVCVFIGGGGGRGWYGAGGGGGWKCEGGGTQMRDIKPYIQQI